MKNTFTILSFCCSLFFTDGIQAQVYNYEPVRLSNTETNPSYLASDKSGRLFSYQHNGSAYDPHHFYQDAIRCNYYNPSFFTGFGLVASHTHVGDSASYTTLGAGLAYRTVLFNKVFLRLGAMYKQTWYQGYGGKLTYYHFVSLAESAPVRKSMGNANLSFSMSSPGDKYFIAAGLLNYRLPSFKADTLLQLPSYAFITVGDFWKILGNSRTNNELSYTCILKRYPGQSSLQLSHYMNTVFRLLQLSRIQQFRVGLRIGITDDRYLQYTPALSYYQKQDKGFFVAQIGLDMSYKVSGNTYPFTPVLQINITRTF